MSHFNTFAPSVQGTPGTAPDIFVASTQDSLAQVLAVGYLNDRFKEVKANDIIYINYADNLSVFPLNPGLSATFGAFQVVVSGGNTSLVLIPPSAQVLAYAQVPVSSAQFLAMSATPVLILPAPASNQVLIVQQAEIELQYNSIAYAGGGNVGLEYGNAALLAGASASTTQPAAGFYATQSSIYPLAAKASAAFVSVTAGLGVYLSNDTAPFTAGNSNFVVNVWYRVMNL